MSRVRGWCPSAHRPMMSGDGLLVRVHPRLGYVSADQMRTLCDLAERYGSGMIDLTSRGNVQLRAVRAADHSALLVALIEHGLATADPRDDIPVAVTPVRRAGGLSERIGGALYGNLAELPEMPAKLGVVVDAEAGRALADVSGDFRFEQGARGLMLRADGAALGWPIEGYDPRQALQDMAEWFVAHGGRAAGRMRRLLEQVDLPDDWQVAPPVDAVAPVSPSLSDGRLGIAFGRTRAAVLRQIMDVAGAEGALVTPWRMLFLQGATGALGDLAAQPDVVSDVSDPRAVMDVCPGAPFCGSSHLDTRAMASRLTGVVDGRLHLSGCGKGCARAGPAQFVVVGTDAGIDLVRDGRADDAPFAQALDETQLAARLRTAMAK